MKLKSAFFACLMVALGFTLLTLLSYSQNMEGYVTDFFGACAMVFLMILPACSTKN